jgi:hypothetical protein
LITTLRAQRNEMANCLTKRCMKEGKNENDSSKTVDNYDDGSANEH